MADVPAQGGEGTSTAPPKAAAAKNNNQGKKGKGKKKKGKGKGNMIDTEPPKGTRDFLPPDMRIRNWLFNEWKEVARLYAFQEYDAPVLESAELYKRKAGEEIVEQMYAFTDKGDREVALRPEMTPSLARMIMKQGKALLLPVRYFSIPQCWRYEQTTRGRKREHYQWNMDIYGEPSTSAEIEILAACVTFFERVGLTSDDVGFKISSRRVLQEALAGVVPDEQFGPVCVIVDKIDKLPREEIWAMLAEVGIAPDVSDMILDTLSKTDLNEIAELLGEDSAAVAELTSLFEYAEAYGIADWCQFDASVVRGLAYYTGIVFEGFDKAGVLRAVCGGGRYDKVLSTYGARQDIPACGFGFGDCVIMELLKEKNVVPDIPFAVDFCVVPFGKELRTAGQAVVARLRRAGASADIILGAKKKMGWSFSYADRIDAQYVVLVAPSEWENGRVKVKNMRLPEDAADKEVEMTLEEVGALAGDTARASASRDSLVRVDGERL